MQLTDAPFILPPASMPGVAPRLTLEQLHQLSGIGDRDARKAGAVPKAWRPAPGTPCSFTRPDGETESGRVREVMGREASIQVEENTFRIVPLGALRPYVPEATSSALRRAVRGQLGVALTATGLPRPISPDGRDVSVTAGYRASSRLSEGDVLAFVAAHYPGAEVLEADTRYPGKLGLVLHFRAGGPAQSVGRTPEALPAPAGDAPALITRLASLRASNPAYRFEIVDDVVGAFAVNAADGSPLWVVPAMGSTQDARFALTATLSPGAVRAVARWDAGDVLTFDAPAGQTFQAPAEWLAKTAADDDTDGDSLPAPSVAEAIDGDGTGVVLEVAPSPGANDRSEAEGESYWELEVSYEVANGDAAQAADQLLDDAVGMPSRMVQRDAADGAGLLIAYRYEFEDADEASAAMQVLLEKVKPDVSSLEVTLHGMDDDGHEIGSDDTELATPAERGGADADADDADDTPEPGAGRAASAPPGEEHLVRELKRDDEVDNPFALCLAGDTVIPCLDGVSRRLDSISPDVEVWTYSFDLEQQLVVPGRARVRGVGSKPGIEITLDNDEKIVCSADHRWVRRDGSLAFTRDLAVGDSLMPFRRSTRTQKTPHEWIYQPGLGVYAPTHQTVARGVNNRCPAGGYVLHHVDHEPANNLPNNLEWQTHEEHQREHALERQAALRAANTGDGNWTKTSAEHKQRMSTRFTARWHDPETRALQLEAARRAAPLGAAAARATHVRLREAREAALIEAGGPVAVCRECRNEKPVTLFCTGRSDWWCRACARNSAARRRKSKQGVSLNHVITGLREVPAVEMFDVAVERHHTFAIEAGVFSHNSWWIHNRKKHEGRRTAAGAGSGRGFLVQAALGAYRAAGEHDPDAVELMRVVAILATGAVPGGAYRVAGPDYDKGYREGADDALQGKPPKVAPAAPGTGGVAVGQGAQTPGVAPQAAPTAPASGGAAGGPQSLAQSLAWSIKNDPAALNDIATLVKKYVQTVAPNLDANNPEQLTQVLPAAIKIMQRQDPNGLAQLTQKYAPGHGSAAEKPGIGGRLWDWGKSKLPGFAGGNEPTRQQLYEQQQKNQNMRDVEQAMGAGYYQQGQPAAAPAAPAAAPGAPAAPRPATPATPGAGTAPAAGDTSPGYAEWQRRRQQPQQDPTRQYTSMQPGAQMPYTKSPAYVPGGQSGPYGLGPVPPGQREGPTAGRYAAPGMATPVPKPPAPGPMMEPVMDRGYGQLSIQFELGQVRMEGTYLVADVTWDPDDVNAVNLDEGELAERAKRFVQMAASQGIDVYGFDFGRMRGKPEVSDLDAGAGVAVVRMRTKGADVVHRVVTAGPEAGHGGAYPAERSEGREA